VFDAPDSTRDQQHQSFPAEVLPCHGTEDAREEWYLFPCPACQEIETYLLDGAPARVVHHPFFTDPVTWNGFKPELTPERVAMNLAIEGYAESLDKSIYCWVGFPVKARGKHPWP